MRAACRIVGLGLVAWGAGGGTWALLNGQPLLAAAFGLSWLAGVVMVMGSSQ